MDDPKLIELLESLSMSLADDLTLGRAIVRGFDPGKTLAPVVAFLMTQQRFLKLCEHLGYTPSRTITGLTENCLLKTENSHHHPCTPPLSHKP